MVVLFDSFDIKDRMPFPVIDEEYFLILIVEFFLEHHRFVEHVFLIEPLQYFVMSLFYVFTMILEPVKLHLASWFLTSMRFKLNVPSFMLDTVSIRGKSHRTEFALKRLLTGVDSLVDL